MTKKEVRIRPVRKAVSRPKRSAKSKRIQTAEGWKRQLFIRMFKDSK